MALTTILTSAERVRSSNPLARRILALDLATRTGWAMHHPDGAVRSGTVEFSHGSHSGQQGASFRNWLTRSQKDDPFDAIYYERINFIAGVRATRTLFHFEGDLLSWSCLFNVPPVPVDVMTIKKFITGNGRAKKPDVIAAVQSQGFDPSDDNEADALALLLYAIEQEMGKGKAA